MPDFMFLIKILARTPWAFVVAGDGSLMDQIYVSSIICPYYLISLSHPSVTDLYIRGVYIPYTKGSVNSSES